jgi:hypothetical protein
MIGSNEIYVGEIDSDDFEDFTIKISVAEGVENVNIPLEVSYYDKNNNFYSQTMNAELKIYPASYVGKAKSNTFLVVVIILLE